MEALLSIVVLLDIIVHNEFDYLYSMKAVHDTAVSSKVHWFWHYWLIRWL